MKQEIEGRSINAALGHPFFQVNRLRLGRIVALLTILLRANSCCVLRASVGLERPQRRSRRRLPISRIQLRIGSHVAFTASVEWGGFAAELGRGI